jgi:hypothetical protein
MNDFTKAQLKIIDFLIKNSFLYTDDGFNKATLTRMVNAGLLEFNEDDAQYEISDKYQYHPYVLNAYKIKDNS